MTIQRPPRRSVAADLAVITAFAAVGALLTVTPASADRLLTGRDFRDGSLTGRDLRDGTVAVRDLTPALRRRLERVRATGRRGAPGPVGPQGPSGAPGPMGPIGVQGALGRIGVGRLRIVVGEPAIAYPTPPGPVYVAGAAMAMCPADWIAVGGGSDTGGARILREEMSGFGRFTMWNVHAWNPTSENLTFRAYAICVSP